MSMATKTQTSKATAPTSVPTSHSAAAADWLTVANLEQLLTGVSSM